MNTSEFSPAWRKAVEQNAMIMSPEQLMDERTRRVYELMKRHELCLRGAREHKPTSGDTP